MAFSGGGDNGKNVGVTNTSAHMAGAKDGLGQIVSGFFAGFGLELGVAPNAKAAEDLNGSATADAIDAGYLWPIDFGLEVTQGDDPAGDVMSVNPPFLGAGFGFDYTHIRTTTRGRTFWSEDQGWGLR